MKFVHSIIDGLNFLILLVLISEDNQGAMFLAENKLVNDRTKHIDIKFHYNREFVEKKDGKQEGKIIKVEK